MSDKLKLIYVTAFNSSFINKDRVLLEKYFCVIPFFFNPYPKWKTPISLIKQLLVVRLKCKCMFSMI